MAAVNCKTAYSLLHDDTHVCYLGWRACSCEAHNESQAMQFIPIIAAILVFDDDRDVGLRERYHGDAHIFQAVID